MDSRFTRPAEDFAKSAAEYIDLKVDEVKLRTAKGLSITLNQILLATLFLSLGSIVLMAAAFGGVLLLKLCCGGVHCRRRVPADYGHIVPAAQEAVSQWFRTYVHKFVLR